MPEKKILKIGYYTIYEVTSNNDVTYKVDSGKTIVIKKFNKVIENSYRDIKNFKTLDKAKEYTTNKMKKGLQKKQKKIDKLPKSLYLILMKEKKTGKTFVKVGITSKKYVQRRFSKDYGYDGYEIESVLRKIKTPHAEKLEEKIKRLLNKNELVKKYRPILESFSGYSECYDYQYLKEIIKIFDSAVNED